MNALKFLTLLLSPIGIAGCAGLLVLWLSWRRHWRLATALLAIGLGWLWWWATPMGADQLVAALQRRYPLRATAELPQADAILLLGGDHRGWQPLCATQPSYCSRTAFAAALYGAQRAPLIVASGAATDEQGVTEAARMREQLIEAGVPDAAIVVEPTARNTRENMRAAAPLLRAHGVQQVLLVTSALHMPRAMANAAAAGLAASAAPSDFDTQLGRTTGGAALMPRYESLQRSERAFKEYLGLAQLRLSEALTN